MLQKLIIIFGAIAIGFLILAIAGFMTMRPARLRLDGNHVHGFQTRDDDLQELAGNQEITYIVIDSEFITAVGLERIATAPNVDTLILSQCKINDAAMQQIAKMAQLRTLLISGPQITNQGLKALAGHPKLRVLKIEGTSITDRLDLCRWN